jgi:hypothetical protein
MAHMMVVSGLPKQIFKNQQSNQNIPFSDTNIGPRTQKLWLFRCWACVHPHCAKSVRVWPLQFDHWSNLGFEFDQSFKFDHPFKFDQLALGSGQTLVKLQKFQFWRQNVHSSSNFGAKIQHLGAKFDFWAWLSHLWGVWLKEWGVLVHFEPFYGLFRVANTLKPIFGAQARPESPNKLQISKLCWHGRGLGV